MTTTFNLPGNQTPHEFNETVAFQLQQFIGDFELKWEKYLLGKKEQSKLPTILDSYNLYTADFQIYPLDQIIAWTDETGERIAPKLEWVKIFINVLLHGPEWEHHQNEFKENYGGISVLYQFCKFHSKMESLEGEMSEKFGFVSKTPKPPKLSPSPTYRPLTLTKNQHALAQQLTKHHKAFEANLELGGFKTRPPLVISPSGSGKTTTVRALAKLRGLPFILIEPSNWVLVSSKTEPYTLDAVHDFIKKHPEGIIAIDECDKFGASNTGDWWRSVQNEAMALIEKKTEFLESRWEPQQLAKLQNKFFIIGMGTWQQMFKKSTFTDWVTFQDLVKEDTIPEELLARFSNPILLEPPTAKDFKEGILRIHAQLRQKLSAGKLKALIQEAIDSEKNIRWLEDYATLRMLETIEPENIPMEIGKPNEMEMVETETTPPLRKQIEELKETQKADLQKVRAQAGQTQDLAREIIQAEQEKVPLRTLVKMPLPLDHDLDGNYFDD